jgi:glycosyltransferase involved in cell wall biosynthesis
MMTDGRNSADPAVWLVVPAYNEARTIVQSLSGLQAQGLRRILVVDDGSTDGTGALAAAAGARVVRHALNRGLGGALGTGLRAAVELAAEAIVTFDADGQHAPEDVARVVAPILADEADLVIGTRALGRGAMPWTRRVANLAANVATRLIFGVWSSDSQSGFRALSGRVATALDLQAQRMEVSSEILHKAARLGLRVREVPVHAIYTRYSLSKGQGVGMGLRTLARLILLRLSARIS